MASCAVLVGSASPVFAQQSWPPGFYRRTNEQTIRWVAPDGLMCTVLNENQLTAFGGEAVVRVVGSRSTYDRGRQNTGLCPWPDGFYREARWSGIWQLLYSVDRRRYYCNITTRDHLDAYNDALDDENTRISVRTVPNQSRLGFKRDWAGDCVWPASAQDEIGL
jgi:hypothetical protein